MPKGVVVRLAPSSLRIYVTLLVPQTSLCINFPLKSSRKARQANLNVRDALKYPTAGFRLVPLSSGRLQAVN